MTHNNGDSLSAIIDLFKRAESLEEAKSGYENVVTNRHPFHVTIKEVRDLRAKCCQYYRIKYQIMYSEDAMTTAIRTNFDKLKKILPLVSPKHYKEYLKWIRNLEKEVSHEKQRKK